MMNLRELQGLVGDIQVLKAIIDNDFGGIENFRQVLKRMKDFDQMVQQMGGINGIRKRLEKR